MTSQKKQDGDGQASELLQDSVSSWRFQAYKTFATFAMPAGVVLQITQACRIGSTRLCRDRDKTRGVIVRTNERASNPARNTCLTHSRNVVAAEVSTRTRTRTRYLAFRFMIVAINKPRYVWDLSLTWHNFTFPL